MENRFSVASSIIASVPRVILQTEYSTMENVDLVLSPPSLE